MFIYLFGNVQMINKLPLIKVRYSDLESSLINVGVCVWSRNTQSYIEHLGFKLVAHGCLQVHWTLAFKLITFRLRGRKVRTNPQPLRWDYPTPKVCRFELK